MKEASQAGPDMSQGEQRSAIELIEQIFKLRLLGMDQETRPLEIELDAFCRRDPHSSQG